MEENPDVVSALRDRGIRHVIYLLHTNMAALHSAIQHAISCYTVDRGYFDFTMLLIPRQMKSCDLLLERAGLLGDVTVQAFNLPWVPLDEDILSLEACHAFKSLAVTQDTTCLYDIAHALSMLQAAWGAIPHIKGKGHWAGTVHRIMARMRQEAGAHAPAPGGDVGIDTIILLDRSVDLVTPMCMQLTYEGLLDEVLGLAYGQIRSSANARPTMEGSSVSLGAQQRQQGERKVVGLTSADVVFAEVRDKFYLSARRWLNDILRSIQQFRDGEMAAADIAQLKGFVSDLRDKFTRMPLHASLVDQIGEALKAPGFSERQKIEAALLDERDDLAAIEDLIGLGEPLVSVLRLLCLYCVVHEGIPKRQWDTLRMDLVNTYGPEQLLTLQALGAAGMLYKREARGRRSAYQACKSTFNLLLQEGQSVDEVDPADIHFTYAGYAPLSVRIVQQAVTEGWSAAETAMTLLPGSQFEIRQTVDDQGLPTEVSEVGARRQKSPTEQRRRVVMVVFIGGVTSAEVSALRFLSRKNLVDCDFLIATTSVVNGSTLLEELVPKR